VAVSATHPVGGACAAARGFAVPEVAGGVVQAATQSVKQAPIRILFNMSAMLDRALSPCKEPWSSPPTPRSPIWPGLFERVAAELAELAQT
jgi:hypothetical protein